MTDEQILKLCGYLTNNVRVVHHSVCQEVPTKVGPVSLAEEARAFFALRDALGVRGYETAAQAYTRLASVPVSEARDACRQQLQIIMSKAGNTASLGDDVSAADARDIEKAVRKLDGLLRAAGV